MKVQSDLFEKITNDKNNFLKIHNEFVVQQFPVESEYKRFMIKKFDNWKEIERHDFELILFQIKENY